MQSSADVDVFQKLFSFHLLFYDCYGGGLCSFERANGAQDTKNNILYDMNNPKTQRSC